MKLLDYINEEFLDKPVRYKTISKYEGIGRPGRRVKFKIDGEEYLAIITEFKNGSARIDFDGPGGFGRKYKGSYEITKKVFSTLYRFLSNYIYQNKRIKEIHFIGPESRLKFYSFLAKEATKLNKNYSYSIEDDDVILKIN